MHKANDRSTDKVQDPLVFLLNHLVEVKVTELCTRKSTSTQRWRLLSVNSWTFGTMMYEIFPPPFSEQILINRILSLLIIHPGICNWSGKNNACPHQPEVIIKTTRRNKASYLKVCLKSNKKGTLSV